MKLEEKIKEEPIYIVSRKIYHLAPSNNNYLIKQLNKVSSMALMNQGTPYEVAAIKDEIEERKDEEKYGIVAKTEKQIISEIEYLLKENIRPEAIIQVLKDNFIENCDLSKKKQEEIFIKLEQCIERTFNVPYMKCLEKIEKAQRTVSKYHTESYMNSSMSQGLGFGIVTNSTSQALLYQTMNNHEIEKQEKLKRMKYENSVVEVTGDVIINKLNEIEQIYYNFGNELKNIVYSIFK